MNKRINAMYFSPTGTTEKIVSGIANSISESIHGEKVVTKVDFTLPEARQNAISFTAEDVVVFGVPVYAGRVPNVLLKYLNSSIAGNGALAVSVVVYGNRNYDDAAIELKDILESNGFKVFAGGAFIGEHSFSKTLAQNRPDEKDMAIVADFAGKICEKIKQNHTQPVFVPGNKPYRQYYMPKDENGNPVDIRKVTPKTNSNCVDCKLCVQVCPMGSIDYEDVSKLNGICIKCGACIKKCPNQAKYFDDIRYLNHKHEIEVNFASRREPELFLSNS
ncbi:EFR1 family ferrodoxin [Desulfallas thermosapovorans]|uniref:Flavodoxin-like protein n=1 Tax=Desulfallas thermosapovorans DSM 6562 TaxID=1121431 RepID=A0A5S4ZNW8_9FIRM|nr:EFR1 family ferrodoxin [Desulfallas thermosapovorans]TYO94424.1 flavodoxin-like protein [Desulfallas thermosapovorans DSM 6562]